MGISRKSPFYIHLFVASTVIGLGLIWSGYHSMETRIITLRYFLFTIAGFIAFVTPYLLFPDTKTTMIQLGNLKGKALVSYLLKKLNRYHWPFLLLFVVMLFGDLDQPADNIILKGVYFLFSILFFAGLNMMALTRYIQSGIDSQFWQESEKGREIRRMMANNFKYPIDPGSIPSLLNTLLITSLGMIAIVLAALFAEVMGFASVIIIGLIVFLIGAIMLIQLIKNPERSFYSTNAFYREFFGSDLEGETVVERRKVDQLWWVPKKLRADVWQFLQQIDRKIPAGRIVAVGHLFLWFIAYQRVSGEFLTVLWILFGVAHQLFILLTLQQSMAPGWLLRWMGSGLKWFLGRVWMQFRWIIPLLLSMNAQLFVFGVPGWREQTVVIIFFLISAVILSGVGVVQLKRDLK